MTRNKRGVEVFLAGPDGGKIEGTYHHAMYNCAPIALCLHPHPLHGGTMRNKILCCAFDKFMENGFSVLRCNYRGVGKSTGSFDQGIGELMDASTALDWLQRNNPDTSMCYVFGVAFGAWLGLQLLVRRPEVTHFIAVAPPVGTYDFSFLGSCFARGLVIHGLHDHVAQESAAFDLFRRITQNGADVKYQAIDANHFFDGKIEELQEIISNYLIERSSDAVMHRQPTKKKKRRG